MIKILVVIGILVYALIKVVMDGHRRDYSYPADERHRNVDVFVKQIEKHGREINK
ncbi:MAG: hypothetical protein ACE5D7_00865 [Fidelibacterota bacterium]